MKKEVNFSELYLNLLETKQTNSAKMETTQLTLCTNSSVSKFIFFIGCV